MTHLQAQEYMTTTPNDRLENSRACDCHMSRLIFATVTCGGICLLDMSLCLNILKYNSIRVLGFCFSYFIPTHSRTLHGPETHTALQSTRNGTNTQPKANPASTSESRQEEHESRTDASPTCSDFANSSIYTLQLRSVITAEQALSSKSACIDERHDNHSIRLSTQARGPHLPRP